VPERCLVFDELHQARRFGPQWVLAVALPLHALRTIHLSGLDEYLRIEA
jgi:hypothetical protein